jgi:hypothetical protein
MGPEDANTIGDLTSVAVGDFNGDGKLDLAVGIGDNVEGSTSILSILLGNGDGIFTPSASNPVVPSAYYIAIADLNQDGIPDLITSNSNAGGGAVLLGRGDGTFQAFSANVPSGTSGFPDEIVTGDFNGDGRPDLAISIQGGPVVIDLTEPTVTAVTPEVTVQPGAPGAHLVEASYQGDNLYQSSTSGTTSLWGQPPATVTAIAVTAAGQAVTTVPAQTAVSFTATVTAGGAPITAGQVNFCDATASSCSDINLIGTAQLTSTGTAVYRFVPSSGTHLYKAIFLENAGGITSTSPNASLTVQAATIPAATTVSICRRSRQACNRPSIPSIRS